MTKDYNERHALKSAVTRAIENDAVPDGLLNVKLFATRNTRGRWAVGVQKMDDKLPRPEFKTILISQNTIGRVIAKDGYRNPNALPALRRAEQRMARYTNSAQIDLGEGFAVQGFEIDLAREDAERWKDQAMHERAAKERAFKDNELLHRVIETLNHQLETKNSVVPSSTDGNH
jgi:hypothetical protein